MITTPAPAATSLEILEKIAARLRRLDLNCSPWSKGGKFRIYYNPDRRLTCFFDLSESKLLELDEVAFLTEADLQVFCKPGSDMLASRRRREVEEYMYSFFLKFREDLESEAN